LQWGVRETQIGHAFAMPLLQSVLTWLGAGSAVLAGVTLYLPRLRRSYWWLVVLHAMLACLLQIVPAFQRDAMVHRLKLALLEAVSPPVNRRRRVPAKVEIFVPAGTRIQPGLMEDLAQWLVDQARTSGWTLTSTGVTVTTATAKPDRTVT
jgi:hypothetical protein